MSYCSLKRENERVRPSGEKAGAVSPHCGCGDTVRVRVSAEFRSIRDRVHACGPGTGQRTLLESGVQARCGPGGISPAKSVSSRTRSRPPRCGMTSRDNFFELTKRRNAIHFPSGDQDGLNSMAEISVRREGGST